MTLRVWNFVKSKLYQMLSHFVLDTIYNTMTSINHQQKYNQITIKKRSNFKSISTGLQSCDPFSVQFIDHYIISTNL